MDHCATGRYRLDPALISTDLQEFNRALDEARHAAGEARLAACRQAVPLYRGELAGGAYEWAGPYAENARRHALDAWTAIAEILRPRDPEPALAALEAALVHDPYNEYLYQKIMRLQAAAGRPKPPAAPWPCWSPGSLTLPSPRGPDPPGRRGAARHRPPAGRPRGCKGQAPVTGARARRRIPRPGGSPRSADALPVLLLAAIAGAGSFTHIRDTAARARPARADVLGGRSVHRPDLRHGRPRAPARQAPGPGCPAAVVADGACWRAGQG